MLPTQMKAVIFEQYGDADVLQYTDFRVPMLERGEALVKVPSREQKAKDANEAA